MGVRTDGGGKDGRAGRDVGEEEETRQRTECYLKGGRRGGRETETARQTNRANVLIHALAQKQGLLLRNPTNVALGNAFLGSSPEHA